MFVKVYYGFQPSTHYVLSIALAITSKLSHQKEQDKATSFLDQLGISHAKVEDIILEDTIKVQGYVGKTFLYTLFSRW